MKINRYWTVGLLIGLSGMPSVVEASLAPLSNGAICSNAVRNGQWETSDEKIKYVEEAKARNISCGIKTKARMPKHGEMRGYVKCDKNPVPRQKNEESSGIYMAGYMYPTLFNLHWTGLRRVKTGQIDRYELFIRGIQDHGTREKWEISVSGKKGFSKVSGNFDTTLPKGESLREALIKGLNGKINSSKCVLRVGESDITQTVPKAEVSSLTSKIESLEEQLQSKKKATGVLERQISDFAEKTAQFEISKRSIEKQLAEQTAMNGGLTARNNELKSQLEKTKLNVAKLQSGTKKEKDLELKIADLNSQREKVAGNLAKAQKELAKTQKEKESLSKSIEDIKKAHQQEIASLKKLIPDATLENQKLTKIASDASGKNSEPTSSASDPITKTKIQIKFEARLLAKAKEFGDGFTNSEASLNKVLLAVEIRNINLQSSSKKNLNRFDYVVIDEGKPAIPESNEVREAVLAQGFQGSGTNTLVKAFEIPMSIDTGSLKVVALDGSTIVGETKLKPK